MKEYGAVEKPDRQRDKAEADRGGDAPCCGPRRTAQTPTPRNTIASKPSIHVPGEA